MHSMRVWHDGLRPSKVCTLYGPWLYRSGGIGPVKANKIMLVYRNENMAMPFGFDSLRLNRFLSLKSHYLRVKKKNPLSCQRTFQ